MTLVPHIPGFTRDTLATTYLIKNVLIFLHESGEENPNNGAYMSDSYSDEEHNAHPDGLSYVYTTPNTVHDKAITLNLITTTYDVNQTPITTSVNIPTHTNKRLREMSISYVTAMNQQEYSCLLYNPRHHYPRTFLNVNNVMLEAGLCNINPWIDVVRTSNRYYANNTPIPRIDSSEDSFKSKTNTNDSKNETYLPETAEYNLDLGGPPHKCTLPIRGRKSNSNIACTVDPCKIMQHVRDPHGK